MSQDNRMLHNTLLTEVNLHVIHRAKSVGPDILCTEDMAYAA